jgi:hypothetical protein
MNLNEFRKFVEVNEKSDIPDIDQLCLEDLVQKIYKKTIKNEEKNK